MLSLPTSTTRSPVSPTGLSAPGGHNKTSLIVQRALAVVTGEPITGERVWDTGVAWYINLGFRHLVFHAPGPDQARFLKLYGETVLPLLRKKYG
mgnify:CR=1 FL=1